MLVNYSGLWSKKLEYDAFSPTIGSYKMSIWLNKGAMTDVRIEALKGGFKVISGNIDGVKKLLKKFRSYNDAEKFAKEYIKTHNR